MKILVVPDTQIKADLKPEQTAHIDWISRYAIDKKPDVIVLMGDWADMSSLSSYDVGKKSFEGRNYKDDCLAANDCLQRLMAPIEQETARTFRRHITRWTPRKVVTLGNHEHRINVAIENDRKLDGLISTKDLFFEQFGFEVYPFLQPVVIEGVAFCHYFASGVMGKPITTARALLTKQHMSCFAGHQQGRDIAYAKRADGKKLTAIICGSCYLHDEDYLNAQTNQHWRGVYMLHEVNDGQFDEMPVSLRFLEERYGPKAVKETETASPAG